MDIRRGNELLWLFTAASASASAALAIWAAATPLAVAENLGPRAAMRPRTAEARAGIPPLKDFEDVWDVELRQPLVDPPRAPVPIVAPVFAVAAPAPALRLTGTIIEPGRCAAVLLLPGGKFEVRTVGEQSGGFEIRSITVDRIVLRQGGRDVTLPIEQLRKAP